MKKALSIAVAASLAVSAIAVSAAPAAARDWHRWRHHDNGGAIAAFGLIAGLAAIAAANQDRDYGYGYYYGYPPRPYYGPYYGRPYYAGYNGHVAWCLRHYRTYNPATNMYFRAPGVPAVCYSP